MDIANLAMQVAVVIGLNEAIKQAFLTDDLKKYLPIISIAVGVLVCITLFYPGTMQGAVLDGLIAGLAAVGLFSSRWLTSAQRWQLSHLEGCIFMEREKSFSYFLGGE